MTSVAKSHAASVLGMFFGDPSRLMSHESKLELG